MKARNEAVRNGWTFNEAEALPPRRDREPDLFYQERKPGNPACPAWGDSGYYDQEARFTDLPVGSAYVLGTSPPPANKPLRGFWRHLVEGMFGTETERALSPEMVDSLVRKAPAADSATDDGTANQERLLRSTERDRFDRAPIETWPG
jgi:hypothetical protein